MICTLCVVKRLAVATHLCSPPPSIHCQGKYRVLMWLDQSRSNLLSAPFCLSDVMAQCSEAYATWCNDGLSTQENCLAIRRTDIRKWNLSSPLCNQANEAALCVSGRTESS